MNMSELFLLFSEYVVYFSVLISVVSIILYRKLDSTIKVFAVYLIVSGAFEVLTYALSSLHLNNLKWLHLYSVLELVILSGFFIDIFKKMQLKYPIRAVSGIVLILCVLNSIFVQPLDSFNSYASTMVSLLIIGYCILTFYHLLDKDDNEYKKIRWIVSGMLLYQMTCFIVLAFGNVLNQIDFGNDLIVWFVRGVIMLITKALFGYVILWAALYNRKSIAW